MTVFPNQNPLFTLLAIFIIFHFPLFTNAQSDSVSFIYSSGLNLQDIVFLGDATSSGDTIHLTRRDEQHGHPLPHSVGRAVYSQPVHIWDAASGNLADFTSVFYFSVNRSGSTLHGDGFAFFMAPLNSAIPNNSTGGLLGLYSPETLMQHNSNSSSFSSSELQFVAVEFDSFANEWDPNPFYELPHVGINVKSVRSATTVGWPSNYFEPDGAIVKARVRYDSAEKELMVMVSYPDSDNADIDCLTHVIDLRTVLPEWVVIGFSGSTGDLVEANDILFWSFKSSLPINTTLKQENITH